MIDVVIFGAGGHGRELADVLEARSDADGSVRLLGFIDDDPTTHGRRLGDKAVLGGQEWLAAHPGVGVVCGVGSPAVRRAVVERLSSFDVHFPCVVHPAAVCTRFVRLGPGTVVTAGCVLTNEIELMAHVHLNRMSTVGHDVSIGAYAHVAPGCVISGNVRIGEGVDVGAGATVIQNLEIGAWSIVGAGATVVNSLPPNVTAVGVPARVIQTRPPGWHETR